MISTYICKLKLANVPRGTYGLFVNMPTLFRTLGLVNTQNFAHAI